MISVHPRIVLAVIVLGNFIAAIDLTIVNVALPTLSGILNASNAELQWIVDAYAIATAGLLLAAGNLGDRYGRRGWLTIGLAVVAASSVVAASANSAQAVIAARVVMGVGAAIIFPTSLALVTNVFVDSTDRARAIGVWSAVTGIAVVVGPILGGWLIDHFSVGSIFWINVPIAVVAIVCANVFVPTSSNPDRPPIDLPGLLLSTVGVTVLTYTLIEAPNIGWASARTATGFALAVGLLAVFLWLERRTWHPILDLSIFANRRFSGGTAAVTTAYLVMCGFIFVATQYLQFIAAYGAFDTGVRLVPLAISYAGSSIVAPRIVERMGTTTVVAGGLVIVAGAVASAGAFEASTPYWVIAAAMASLGSGLGLTMAPASEAILGSLSPAAAGVGSAVTGVARQLGGCLGVAIVGSVFASVYMRSMTNSDALLGIDPARRAAMRQSMAAAKQVLDHLPVQDMPGVRHAIESAFLQSLGVGCLVCAAFAVVGAAVVAFLLPARGGGRDEGAMSVAAAANEIR
ncbi:Antiseptic resistance protein [Mycobacterium marinum]|uniref:DHA2 family efflux MFS transporter permease subunit n=1 Tax=Mycobacterium marinum TaxID=1781 RepID=UPI000E3EBECB|nr:DHA2 family efflux MFS transporter permease subunit [Mycobacterium marinum]RFZ69366.1 Antiseptic resistance protein [Mycobacterium marinum]